MALEKVVKKYFHPNRLSAYGLGLTGIGVGLLFNPSTQICGLITLGVGYCFDYVDGKVARKFNLETKEGAKLDPLFDKVKNVMVGGFVVGKELILGNYAIPAAMGINFCVDAYSQAQRGKVLDQIEDSYNAVVSPEKCSFDLGKKSNDCANHYGKVKTVLQMGVNLGYLVNEVYVNNFGDYSYQDNIKTALASSLVVSAALGAVGVAKRIKKASRIRKKSNFADE